METGYSLFFAATCLDNEFARLTKFVPRATKILSDCWQGYLLGGRPIEAHVKSRLLVLLPKMRSAVQVYRKL
jgi:hypothetical protein